MTHITLDEAKRIAAAAQQRAAEIDKPITVVIVDAGGFPVLVERMDGARPLQAEIATSKAYTGAVMQRPGTMLRGWSESDPLFFAQVSQMGHKAVVAAQGALPLKKNGEIIGGIGIAGGTGEDDEQVAIATLEDTGYELDFVGFNTLK